MADFAAVLAGVGAIAAAGAAIVYAKITSSLLREAKRQITLLTEQLDSSEYHSFEARMLDVDIASLGHINVKPFCSDKKDIDCEHPLYPEAHQMAELLADFFDHALVVLDRKGRNDATEHPLWKEQKPLWKEYIVDSLELSPILRRFCNDNKEWYGGGLKECLKTAEENVRLHGTSKGS